MIMTVELSMYPFNQEYRPLIGDFIKKLNTYSELVCVTTPTATMITGEYHSIMDALQEMFLWSYETHGRAVFVSKFIPGYEPE